VDLSSSSGVKVWLLLFGEVGAIEYRRSHSLQMLTVVVILITVLSLWVNSITTYCLLVPVFNSFDASSAGHLNAFKELWNTRSNLKSILHILNNRRFLWQSINER